MPRMSTHGQPRPQKRYRPTLIRSGTRVGNRRKSRNRQLTVPRNKIGFAQSFRTKLRYVTKKDMVVGSIDTVEFEKFRANGMYDPEVSLGGHQPRGFDQAMALYGVFTVLGSKISVNWAYAGYDGPAALDATTSAFLIKTNKPVDTSGDGAVVAGVPVMCGIYKGTEALANPSSAAQIMEHDRTVWKPMNHQQPGIITSASARIGSFYGNASLVGTDDYSGTASADPAEQVQYTIWCGRTNGTSAGVCAVTAYVTIEYDVLFTEPKVLQAS
uniref:Capsid protein n=1 Tax=uncultured marine virus TaxID=186617 RepID=S4TEL1_9VIRU|nr:hypothetical protein [uncultured marine virus]